MKILFLTTGYPWGRDYLGGSFHKTLAEGLVRIGVDVNVVAPVPLFDRAWPAWRAYDHPPRYYEINSVQVRRPRFVLIPGLSDWMFIHSQYSSACFRSGIDDVDIIHAHYSYPCGLAAIEVARRLGIPSVLTLHGSDVDLYPFRNKLRLLSFRKAVRGQDAVTAVSSSLAGKTHRLAGVLPLVQPLGIDASIFKIAGEKERTRREIGLPDKPIAIVLYVGALVPAKGVVELLGALRILEKERVVGVFCGDGKLHTMVRACRNAIHAGIVSPAMVAKYLNAADLLVLPSYHEGLGLVLVEAGFAGTPVIGTAVGGIPELLDDDRGVMIPPRSVDAIVEAIRLVLRDTVRTVRRVRRFSEFVSEKYDVNRCADKFRKLYEWCISGKRNVW